MRRVALVSRRRVEGSEAEAGLMIGISQVETTEMTNIGTREISIEMVEMIGIIRTLKRVRIKTKNKIMRKQTKMVSI